MTTTSNHTTTAQMITDLFAKSPCGPIHHRYDGELYTYQLEISGSDVSIGSRHRDNNGTRMDIYYGQTRCINLGVWYDSPNEDEAQELALLVSRVQDGLDIEWDGSNHIGTLTQDASDAEDDLTGLLGLNGILDRACEVYVNHDLAYEGLRDDLAAIKGGADIEERVLAWSNWSDDGITYIVDHADIREWLEEMMEDAN